MRRYLPPADNNAMRNRTYHIIVREPGIKRHTLRDRLGAPLWFVGAMTEDLMAEGLIEGNRERYWPREGA